MSTFSYDVDSPTYLRDLEKTHVIIVEILDEFY